MAASTKPASTVFRRLAKKAAILSLPNMSPGRSLPYFRRFPTDRPAIFRAPASLCPIALFRERAIFRAPASLRPIALLDRQHLGTGRGEPEDHDQARHHHRGEERGDDAQ